MEMTSKGLYLKQFRANISDKFSQEIKNRRTSVVIYRLRTGHAGLMSYLHRFDLSNTDLCPHCLVPETIEHYLLQCSYFATQRNQLITKLQQLNINQISTQLLLGGIPSKESLKIPNTTASYISQTGKLDAI